jgi:hypothetical protein
VACSGEVLVTSERRRHDDGLREVRENSSAWSRTSIASRRRRKGRLELLWAAVYFGFAMSCLICCRLERNRWIRRRGRLRGRGGVRKETVESPAGVGIVDARPQNLRVSVDEFRRPRFVPSGRTKGREERGERALYRHGPRTKRAGIDQY